MDNIEWKLNQSLFHKVCAAWDVRQVDLFVSRLNHLVPVAWKPDPGPEAIDAFTEDWADVLLYAFTPFNLVGRLLQKLKEIRHVG